MKAENERLRAEVEMLRDAFSDDDMTAGAHWFGRYVEQKRRAERLAEALRSYAEALERLAFAIPAPNTHTPQLVELAIAMRAAAQGESHE